MRSLAREIYSQVKQSSNETHAIELCDILARHDHFEAKMVDVLVLSRYHRQFPRHLLETSRRWIEAGWFANWAAIDGLCPNILTPLIQRYPEYLPRVTQWVRSRDRWLRRTCLITLLPLARRGRHLDESYAAVAELLDDPEDLIHKACGWLLREAGRADLHRRRLLVQTRN
jgi:3-methyladenine DNA glycosylase AlkD